MQMSSLTLVKRQIEYLPAESVHRVPRNMHGLYVLYLHRPVTNRYNVRYIGMASGHKGHDVRQALQQNHPTRWTHCSAYELWDGIGQDDNREVDALFLHIYRHDASMKHHASKSLRCETQDNSHLPRELFRYFVSRLVKK